MKKTLAVLAVTTGLMAEPSDYIDYVSIGFTQSGVSDLEESGASLTLGKNLSNLMGATVGAEARISYFDLSKDVRQKSASIGARVSKEFTDYLKIYSSVGFGVAELRSASREAKDEPIYIMGAIGIELAYTEDFAFFADYSAASLESVEEIFNDVDNFNIATFGVRYSF